MAARSEKRKLEADKLMSEGRELLKTTFMRWSPDFLMAAMKFKQAADRYKGLRMKKDAREAFMRTYECELAQRNHFQAGKMADQASKCVDDGDDGVEADLLQKAYDAYIEAMEWRVAMNTAKTCAQKWVLWGGVGWGWAGWVVSSCSRPLSLTLSFSLSLSLSLSLPLPPPPRPPPFPPPQPQVHQSKQPPGCDAALLQRDRHDVQRG